MIIDNIDFGEGLVLAPMAGVTDVGFRDVCSCYGADATYSEMLSCRAMIHNPKKTSLMTIYSPNEKIKIGQIFGHEPDIMAEAIKSPYLKQYQIIDINMGCPAPKIVKNGEGSALMGNIPLASKIISACVENSNRPVSVKFRLGIKSDMSLDFGRMCEDSGANFVTLHARTSQQGYSGNADYEAIARLKAALKIPVIGNGDVDSRESYMKMKETGVDGVMIGRGSLGRPFVFSLIKGIDYDKDVMKMIKRHIDILREHYNEDWLIKYIRKHLLWYMTGLKGGNEARAQVATSPSIENSLKIIENLIKNQ